ncbi:EpsI family protein [Actimicrobium sp. GrIS 1.19]|uniref:exosortase-associated protein EpsI, B-type n=1 Tax=Actimicrobium sp. GrIS 1.19 TaxID=3071708 RepID=UPI002DFE6CEB|nr:EpsI family protein [Actimicrobium sp. GrIS 1.19]
MKPMMLVSFSLGALMLLTTGLTHVMTPTTYFAQSRPKSTLERAVPKQFGDWKEEIQQTANIISPDRIALLNKLYSETLTRTYVNSAGERVMLSIAYGQDQRKGNEVHYPEVCYPAQGFELTSLTPSVLKTEQGSIVVNRLETNLSKQRYEPVTYWTTIGNQVTLGGSDKRVKELAFGLKGVIPDGLVFRVSTIDREPSHAYGVQDAFVNALLGVLT